jgi:hypothetical protein
MYGIMSRPKKTTIYLQPELKKDVERAAKLEQRSEADVIRDAVSDYVDQRFKPQPPRIPLVPYGLGAPDIAECAEELLDGFGR